MKRERSKHGIRKEVIATTAYHINPYAGKILFEKFLLQFCVNKCNQCSSRLVIILIIFSVNCEPKLANGILIGGMMTVCACL